MNSMDLFILIMNYKIFGKYNTSVYEIKKILPELQIFINKWMFILIKCLEISGFPRTPHSNTCNEVKIDFYLCNRNHLCDKIKTA